MEDKVRRLCSAFSSYNFDVDIDSMARDLKVIHEQRTVTKDIIRQTKINFISFLETANRKGDITASVFKVYKVFLLRERAIYTHLNMFRQQSVVLQGLAWVPRSEKFD
jgi:vacuolar-type H+-ATPase subunit I/STV1